MTIIISACLLGQNCKYNGGNNYSDELNDFMKNGNQTVIPVCPETLGGFPIPRVPAEIANGIVTNREGVIVDNEFRRGAEAALEIALTNNADLAILQSRSPSCGVGRIYDGTFSKTLIDGNGIFAELLIQNGIRVCDVADL
ncbi:MAG: DUF523 domain-containing protein [Spirochaetales bacterium]|nr:DUF523 domain-containing protein [Spirochaetales bacterium]